MTGPDRKVLIEQQKHVTGIDFVRVVDALDQRQLHVYFLLDPLDPAVLAQPFDATAPLPPGFVRIEGIADGSVVAITNLAWRLAPDVEGAQRRVLEVQTQQPGSFQRYRLTLTDEHVPSRIDPFFNAVEFSFKQACPSDLDCRGRCECPPAESVDWPVDYLARDFESFRNALLEFAAQRYPDWQERIPADVGSMFAELLAALGDEFSYIQDRYAREAYLETLSERRSLAELARLVDYRLDEGLSARTWLQLTVTAGGQNVPAGARVWADVEGHKPVPFEIGEGLRSYYEIPAAGRSQVHYWVHVGWQNLAAHVPDEKARCLPIGAQELWVVGQPLIAGNLPGTPDPEAIPGFWIGRHVLIETRPAEAEAPRRRAIVEIDAPVVVTQDPLIRDANDVTRTITRLHWRAADALPFELDLSCAYVSANVVPATAGRTVVEYVAVQRAPAEHGNLPRTVERDGPFDPDQGARATIHRWSLPASEEEGLGWLYASAAPGLGELPQPEVLVREVQPGATKVAEFTPGDVWDYRREILRADELDEVHTLEAGTWREVISFERGGTRIGHTDYAAREGTTVRWGDGTFGRRPPDGTVFRIIYRTGPGRRANVPANTIVRAATPDGNEKDASPSLLGISAVCNPLPVDSGRDPEDQELARRIMPEAFRALLFFAVTNADYAGQAQRLEWVQRAGATTRWTGSWLSTFVTPDPRGSFALSPARRRELEDFLDGVRQTGREVLVLDPVYVDIDLDLGLCIEPGAYFGQAKDGVIRALTGPARPGQPLPFFHPDRFTFGDGLARAELEAAVHAVPGVHAVPSITIRRRGQVGYTEFDEEKLEVGADRLLRLRNDPRFPEQGTLRVHLHKDEKE